MNPNTSTQTGNAEYTELKLHSDPIYSDVSFINFINKKGIFSSKNSTTFIIKFAK